jgi:hypothetical protein
VAPDATGVVVRDINGAFAILPDCSGWRRQCLPPSPGSGAADDPRRNGARQASIAGFRIHRMIAADRYQRFTSMLMTAAGTVASVIP